MKILQVSPYFYPYIGGQERYVKSLARALIDRGHEVVVLTSNFPKGRKSEIIEEIKIRRFEFLFKPLNNPVSPTLLIHLMKYSRVFDIVHCHNEHAAVSQYCLSAKSVFKIPLIITCHGRLRFDNPAKDFLERMYSRTFGATLLKKANIVITISESDKEYVNSLGVPLENIKVIPNGVDLAYFEKLQIDPLEKMEFNGKRVILFVGPVIKRKGPHILVRAIPHIIKHNPDVIFVFAGKGNFLKAVESLSRFLHVEKHTRFLGYVPENKLYSLYKHCEMLVLPSFSEALSYTILDAFVFSKPVISTLIPCIKDYLNDVAVLVPPGDHEALAKAVLRLLNEPKLAKKIGEKGRKLVATRFRWDVIVNEIESVYNEALNN